MVPRNAKTTFVRCRDLREQAGLSMTKLAAEAGVSRDLVRSLENGGGHSRHKVLPVFQALQALHNGSLSAEDELAFAKKTVMLE